MKSTKNRQAFLTGLFVVAGFAILLAGVFIVGGKNNAFTKTIIIKAIFEDVAGLTKGNNVWYAGVKVGTVKNMVFAGKGVEVEFTLDESVKERIRLDSKVKLSSDGLIGNKLLVIYGGSGAVPAVVTGSILPVEKALSTETMLSTLQENNQNLVEITTDFKNLSASLLAGKGTIGKLLTDETLVKSLQTTLGTLNKASAHTEQLTANLANFSGQLNQKGSLTHYLLTDTTTATSLKTTVAQLQDISGTAHKAVQNLQNSTEAVNDTVGTLGLILNNEATAASFKNTMQNLESSTLKLDENMEALQHNFLLRGFFRKKAKAEKNKKVIDATISQKKV